MTSLIFCGINEKQEPTKCEIVTGKTVKPHKAESSSMLPIDVLYVYKTIDGEQHVDSLGPRDLTNVLDKPAGDDHPGLIVQGYVQGMAIAATIASGSWRTVMSQRVYNEIPQSRRPPLRSVGITFCSLNGAAESAVGVATMTVRVASHSADLEVLVFERCSAQCLLGEDFQRLARLLVNWDVNSVTTRSGEAKLKLMYFSRVYMSGFLQPVVEVKHNDEL